PHVIGWIFLVGAVLYCETAGKPRLLLVAIAGCLWANLHASFFLGPAIALVYAIGSWLRQFLWDDREGAPPRHFLMVAAVSAAAGLVNPYGWNLYRHIFEYLRNSELLGRIGEFQSFDFHSDGSGQILLAVLIGIGGGVLALYRRRPEHFALAVLFCAGALRSARGLPLAALVLLPIANGAIQRALADAATRMRPRVRIFLESFLNYTDRLEMFDRRFLGFACAPVLIVLCWILLQ